MNCAKAPVEKNVKCVCVRASLFVSHSARKQQLKWKLRCFGVWKIDGAPDKLFFSCISEVEKNIRLKRYKTRARERFERSCAVHGKDVSNLQGRARRSEWDGRMPQWDEIKRLRVYNCWAMCGEVEREKLQLWLKQFCLTGSRLVTLINRSRGKKDRSTAICCFTRELLHLSRDLTSDSRSALWNRIGIVSHINDAAELESCHERRSVKLKR